MLIPVAALCVSGRSIYKHLPGVDAFDLRRDARTFAFDKPVVAHPPCRHWSLKLSHQADPRTREDEMALGRFCVRALLACGGVLEQPAFSRLLDLARRTNVGFQISFDQSQFGFPCRKPTWLWVVGLAREEIPPIPICASMPIRRHVSFSQLNQSERSRTLPALANWLVAIARLAKPPAHAQSLASANAAAHANATASANQPGAADPPATTKGFTP